MIANTGEVASSKEGVCELHAKFVLQGQDARNVVNIDILRDVYINYGW